jgi:hypothetical protein
MVTAGIGLPEAASWPGVYSTRVLPDSLSAHRSPEPSKATLPGEARLVPFAEIVTAGAGVPEVASWLAVYSTRVLLSRFAIHRSPAASKASVPNGESRLVPFAPMLTAGAALPDAESG